jgi:hypothetical protein
MTSKDERALRRKNKALKDTTRGGEPRLDRRHRRRYFAKTRADSNKNDAADAIIDYDYEIF